MKTWFNVVFLYTNRGDNMGECILSGQGSNNAIEKELEKKITYGTADLTAGSSTLATGTLYFVYE